MRSKPWRGFVLWLMVTGIFVWSSSAAQRFVEPEYPLTALELNSLCTSNDADSLEYCDGYMAAATHFYSSMVECGSQPENNPPYCAGTADAAEAVRVALEACQACNVTPEALTAVEEAAKVMAGLPLCSPEDGREADYCSGYNAELQTQIAQQRAMLTGARPRVLGWDEADVEIFAHAFASPEFHSFPLCLSARPSRQDLTNAFLKYLDKTPEGSDLTAVMSLQKGLFYSLCLEPGQQWQPHMEHCTVFRYENEEYVTENNCDEPVSVQFLAPNLSPVERTLASGQAFSSGSTPRGFYLFATCPAGYTSFPAFGEENRSVIASSQYDCVTR